MSCSIPASKSPRKPFNRDSIIFRFFLMSSDRGNWRICTSAEMWKLAPGPASVTATWSTRQRVYFLQCQNARDGNPVYTFPVSELRLNSPTVLVFGETNSTWSAGAVCRQTVSGISSDGHKIPITLRGWPGLQPVSSPAPARLTLWLWKCSPCWTEGVYLQQPFDSWGKNSGVQRSEVTPDEHGEEGCLHQLRLLQGYVWKAAENCEKLKREDETSPFLLNFRLSFVLTLLFLPRFCWRAAFGERASFSAHSCLSLHLHENVKYNWTPAPEDQK